MRFAADEDMDFHLFLEPDAKRPLNWRKYLRKDSDSDTDSVGFSLFNDHPDNDIDVAPPSACLTDDAAKQATFDCIYNLLRGVTTRSGVASADESVELTGDEGNEGDYSEDPTEDGEALTNPVNNDLAGDDTIEPNPEASTFETSSNDPRKKDGIPPSSLSSHRR
jgi:hypothetical protein